MMHLVNDDLKSIVMKLFILTSRCCLSFPDPNSSSNHP